MEPEASNPKTPPRLWVFVFAGVLAMTVLFLSVDARTFKRQYTLHVYSKDVGGLHEGASVRLDGLDVGWVEAIRFGPRDGVGHPDRERNFDIELRILQKFQGEIRADSFATLVTEGLLAQRYVQVKRGFSEEILQDGGVLRFQEAKTFSMVDFLDRLSVLAKCVELQEELQGKEKRAQESGSGNGEASKKERQKD